MRGYLLSSVRFVSALALVLGTIVASGTAAAFVDTPVLSPTNPLAGEVLTVSIRHGVCDGFISTPPVISQTGNAINMVLETTHFDDPIFCQDPISTAVFNVGVFSAGTYTLHVERFYETLVPFPVFETLGDFTFTVGAASSPTTLPSLSFLGGVILFAGLVGLVAARRRRLIKLGSLCAVLALSALPYTLRAQEPSYVVEVLLSGEPGSPTPEEVVFWADGSAGGDPPLAAFNSVSPEGVSFLLSRRAPPDLSAWLEQHPESDRARLERYLLIRYPGDIDAEVALQSLRADAAIEYAYVSPPVEFSSAELSGFEVADDAPLERLVDDYQWSTLNLEAAWFQATGYALIGIADTGLYTDHAALRQFSATGQYIGGNFIPAASLDVGRGSSMDYNVDEQEPEPITDPVCNPSGLPGIPLFYAGHGTHVSGLVGANVNSALGLKGTCKHCGIAMARVVYGTCRTSGLVLSNVTFPSVTAGLTWLIESGVQVINMSLGVALLDPADIVRPTP